MTITKFTLPDGRIASEERLTLAALDEKMVSKARDALTHLQDGPLTLTLALAAGEEATIRLGLPHVEIPLDQLPEGVRRAMADYESSLQVQDERKRDHFYITASGVTDIYHLIRSEASEDSRQEAGLFGAVAGAFGGAEFHKPLAERDPRSPEERRPEFLRVVRRLVGAAPSYMCRGWTQGAVADFGDCFAVAMLMDTGATPDSGVQP